MLWLIAGAARTQLRMTRRNIEDWLPVFSTPLSTVITLAIIMHAGRPDLAGYAIVAVVLMTLSQMGFFVGTEFIAHDRQIQILDLIVASPASYFAVLGTRVFVLTAFGVAGFAESWLIAWLVFDVRVIVHHPAVLVMTLGATVFAVAATTLVFAPLCSFGRTPRTIQNAIGGPLFLLGGVLVPVTYLPGFVQPISRGVFLYWAADLLRDSLRSAAPLNVPGRLFAILMLGLAAGAAGLVLIDRLLTHLRREGTLGLS